MKKKQVSHSFLPTVVLGCMIFFGSSLMARDTQQEKKYSDNASTKKPNVKYFVDDDGSNVQVEADGTKIINKPDGSSVRILRDGSKLIKDPNGTIIQINADGTKTIKKSDGSSIQVKPPSGSKDVHKH